MKVGEKNKNNQQLVLKTDSKSTTHPYAKIWVMRCSRCGNEYGCNSCDAHIRLCPNCNTKAAKGEPISTPPQYIWYTTLLLDAMYYHAAKLSFNAAKKALKGIGIAKKRFAELKQKEEDILDRHDGDSYKAYDELEQIYIQMDHVEHDIGAAYGPYLQQIAITHILCVTSAETHINVVAKEKLRGKYWKHFERITLEGKWLFLPKIIGSSSFDQGAEPFQSFSKLIKYRNDLIHYKGIKEEWEFLSRGKPKFLKTLGLSLTEARSSLKTIRNIILALSDMIGNDPPYWLRKGYDDLPSDIVTNFFDIELK